MIAINEMIKIILGIAVIVAVLFGLYFFGNYFTKNNETTSKHYS